MQILQLHTVPALKTECAEVLNEEWKRSLSARLHSLDKSRDSFPVSLVLVGEREDGRQYVIGHSMLSVVRGQAEPSCLVESVVVRKSLRGKGYGRIIMEKTEEFAVSKGYRVMYLTTHDKQKFYEHLGYKYCSPIVCFVSDIVPESLANKFLGNLTVEDNHCSSAQANVISSKLKLSGHITESVGDSVTDNDSVTNRTSCDTNKVAVKEDFSANHPVDLVIGKEAPEFHNSAPPAPACVIPPPPPPVKATSPSGDKVSRWDPKLVSWMKKEIG